MKSASTPKKARVASAPTPFKIVKNPLPIDHFHKSIGGKKSYYQDALQALARSPRGSVLEFGGEKCYPQVRKAASKLGFEVHYAIDSGRLYCQILDTGEDK